MRRPASACRSRSGRQGRTLEDFQRRDAIFSFGQVPIVLRRSRAATNKPEQVDRR